MYYATQSIATTFTDNMELLYVTNKLHAINYLPKIRDQSFITSWGGGGFGGGGGGVGVQFSQTILS